MSKTRAVLSLLAVAVVTLSQPALARGLRCVVTDPEGEPLWQFATDNIEVQPYRDIVQAEVMKVGRIVFTFAMDMAGEVSDLPAFLLPSVSLMIWTYLIDTDPDPAPAGYPLAPGVSHAEEFLVRVIGMAAASEPISSTAGLRSLEGALWCGPHRSKSASLRFRSRWVPTPWETRRDSAGEGRPPTGKWTSRGARASRRSTLRL